MPEKSNTPARHDQTPRCETRHNPPQTEWTILVCYRHGIISEPQRTEGNRYCSRWGCDHTRPLRAIKVVPASTRSELHRVREALERVAESPCDNNDTGGEGECPDLFNGNRSRYCPICVARAALSDPPEESG